MSRGPRARTDVENTRALADLATGSPSPAPSERPRGRSAQGSRTTRQTKIVEEEPEDIYTLSGEWVPQKIARWECPVCKRWTNDRKGKTCVTCRKRPEGQLAFDEWPD